MTKINLGRFDLLSLAVGLVLSCNLYADNTFQDVDVTPVVNHFRKQVVTLKQVVTTYNWAPHSDGDFWDKERPQDDPELLSMFRNLAGSFWREYGSKEGASLMYGFGLYTAVDPVTTAGYGGLKWRVTQIQFPVGARILDLGNYNTVDTSDGVLTKAALDILERFECPRKPDADTFFVNGGASLKPKCRQLIYEIFDRILKIDAFAYGYGGTAFRVCEGGNYQGQRAFVVTRPDWIQSQHAHLYTAESRLNEEERIRIQTLFLLSISNAVFSNLTSPLGMIEVYLDEHPDHDLESSKTVCDGDTCVITARFCDLKKSCDEVALPPIARPGGPTITEAEANRSKLLWKDLIGKPKTPTITTWLKDNKFACSGDLPYQVK